MSATAALGPATFPSHFVTVTNKEMGTGLCISEASSRATCGLF